MKADIVLLSRSEARKINLEIEKHLKKKVAKRPLLFDALIPDDRLKTKVARIWQKEEEGDSFFKNYLALALKLTFVALLIYNAASLYFNQNWLFEKINNLALASKAHIAQAQESANFEELNKAQNNFALIKEELLNQGEYNYFLPNHPLLANELNRGQKMLELGLLSSQVSSDFDSLAKDLEKSEGGDLAEKTEELKLLTKKTEARINRAQAILKADPTIAGSLGLGGQVEIYNLLDKTKKELSKAGRLFEEMPLILGAGGNNQYLVLFMNNAEMRPGGGFPGNYGVVSISNNQFQGLYINDIYYLQWLKWEELKGLNKDNISLPKDLHLPDKMDEITKGGYYNLFSSNWSLDFKENAERAAYLYENVYGEGHVSGVIALTPNLVEDILGIVGPVEMDDYGVVISRENFREVMEYKVEVDNPFKLEGRRETNPKQIIADFGPKFLAKIKESGLSQKLKIAAAGMKSIEEKQLLFYHQEPEVEAIIQEFGASGEIEQSEGDFLGIASLNLNAMKNGQMIDTRARLSSEIGPAGLANNQLSLTIVNNETNPRYLHGFEESYYQILVPSGAKIKEAKMQGKDIKDEVDVFEEASRSVFGFLVHLQPGEAVNVVLKYQAPLKGLDSGHNLHLFKQAGAKPIEFQYSLATKTITEPIDKDKVIGF